VPKPDDEQAEQGCHHCQEDPAHFTLLRQGATIDLPKRCPHRDTEGREILELSS
jgi:hypothetical protein